MTGWVKECREGEMSGSWRALGTEEGLGGQLLLAPVEGTQGRVTEALGASGALWGHGSLGARQGYPVLHTCGTGFHETGGDG